VKEMSEEQETYLPTAEELEQMNKEAFRKWVFEAQEELIKRAEKRDPFFRLRK
jgi:hypothetical protein